MILMNLLFVFLIFYFINREHYEQNREHYRQNEKHYGWHECELENSIIGKIWGIIYRAIVTVHLKMHWVHP